MVESALGQPWRIFQRDVSFPDFLDLVARHVAATLTRQHGTPRNLVLAKCSVCTRWRRLPDDFELTPANESTFSCEDIDRCLARTHARAHARSHARMHTHTHTYLRQQVTEDEHYEHYASFTGIHTLLLKVIE